MNLEVELGSAEAVIGEPVAVRLRLAGVPAGLPFPVDYNASDVTTFVLMDAEGRVLATADGYDKTARLGSPPGRKPQSTLQTHAFDEEREIAWSEDLLAHFDLAEPGSYLVEVRFTFAPAGIDLASARLPLAIKPNRCRFLDLSQDRVCLPTTCLVVQHRDDPFARTFLRVSDSMNPGRFWEGASLDIPAGAEPIASEADFSTTLTFQHDFFRWLAWIDRGSLFATYVKGSTPLGRVFEVPLPLASPALFGRPIQHADGSVSVTLLGHLDDGSRGVYRMDVSAAGAASPLDPIAGLAADDVPVACAPDVRGAIYLAATTHPGRPPLRMLERRPDGSVQHRELLSAGHFEREGDRDLRVVAVRLALKPFQGPRAALVAGVLDHDPRDPNEDDQVELIQIFLDAPPEGHSPIAVLSVPFFRGLLAPGETLVSADLVRVKRTQLHALLATSSGQLFHASPGGALRSIARVSPAEAAGARLATTPDHAVTAFLPSEERGVVELPLVRVVRL
jgi:hypothetical protein